jgi:aspartate aminotransferase
MRSPAMNPASPAAAHVPSVNLNLNVRGLSASATLAINERSAELVEAGKDIIKLGL